MTKSYKRTCKYCGAWIQMRQMPAGQWMAFEGYDTAHKCNKSASKKQKTRHPRPRRAQEPKRDSESPELENDAQPYDNLGFDDIAVSTSTKDGSETPKQASTRLRRGVTKPPEDEKSYAWIFWVIIIIGWIWALSD